MFFKQELKLYTEFSNVIEKLENFLGDKFKTGEIELGVHNRQISIIAYLCAIRTFKNIAWIPAARGISSSLCGYAKHGLDDFDEAAQDILSELEETIEELNKLEEFAKTLTEGE